MERLRLENMFSNNLNFNNIDTLQSSERILFGRLDNVELRHVETANNTRVCKEEKDLINLLDDFSISPKSVNKKETKIDDLQIKELEKFLSNTGTCNLQKSRFTTEQDKEYQMFFDKYERKTKADNIANNIEVSNKGAGSLDLCINQNYTGTPKVLVPKIDQEPNQEHNEDLIDEVLLEKNLEKQQQRLPPPSYLHKFNDNVINLNNRENESPSCNSKNSGVVKSDIMDQIISNNKITVTKSKVDDKDIHLTNNLFTEKEIPKQRSNVKIEEMVSKYNMKYLEAIRMDEKVFQNQSILKTEAEKTHLTLGPTLHDKSIVLPQIMKRLADKKQSLDEHAHLNRKLVLDTSSPHYKHVKDNDLIVVNPSESYDHAKNLNYPSCVRQIDCGAMAKSDNISTNFNVISKNNQTPETSGSQNKHSIAAENDIYRDSRFIHIDKLKNFMKEKNLAEEGRSTVWAGAHVLKPPQPLMRDCNKARFVANATSQLINDFVNGKI